jgi:hypothetical protein
MGVDCVSAHQSLKRAMSRATMSLDLALVSQIMYLREGEVNPGDESRVVRYKKKMSDWRQDAVSGSKNLQGKKCRRTCSKY